MKDNTTSMKTLTFLDLQTESFEEDRAGVAVEECFFPVSL